MLKIAKTDMRNIQYTLELFIDIAGNICKKIDMKSLKFKNIIICVVSRVLVCCFFVNLVASFFFGGFAVGGL